MTVKERIAAIKSEIRPLHARVKAENRDFTAEENVRVRALLAEAAQLQQSLETITKSREISDELKALLESGAEANTSTLPGQRARRKGREGRQDGAWTAALSEALPGMNLDHGSKGITLPPMVSFIVPAPQPIAAQNIPFGHLLDVISSDASLRGPSVSFLRSVARVRASRPTALGALKPSKALTLEKVDAPAVTIAVILEEIRKQDLDDYSDLIKFIDFELQGDVVSTLDQQMLLGTGLNEELLGLFYTDGVLVQQFATSASASLRRAMAAVEQGGHENTAVVLNPVDYAELELELNTAGDYRGNVAPAEAGPRRVWGVPVASVATAPLGLAVVGDLSQVNLWIREQVQVNITETSGDDFRHNLFTARAEMRAAFGVSVPPALSLVALNDTVVFPTLAVV